MPGLSSEHRSRDGFAVLLLVLLAAVVFSDVLFAGRQLYLRDLTKFYYPSRRVLREIVSGGYFPYWNPYYGAGQPMAANPEYAVFYPPQWLVFLPDYNLAFRLHIVFHVALALAGMYALLRSMRRSRAAAVFGAVSFGLSGVFLSGVNLLPILFCASWIPLVLLFGCRLLRDFSWRDLALGSLAGGMQILTAEPTTLIQTWGLLGAYAIYRAAQTEGLVPSVRVGARAAALLAGAVAVGAAQLVPALDFIRDSARAFPLPFALVSTWSMPPARLVELLYPDVFGHLFRGGTSQFWGGNLYPVHGTPFLLRLYCGILVTLLAATAVMRRRRGTGLLLAICAGSFIVAAGAHTPVLRLMYDAGVFRSLRYPEKFALAGLFAMIVAAAAALDDVLQHRDRRTAAAAAGLAAAVGLGAVAALVVSFSSGAAGVLSSVFHVPAEPAGRAIAEAMRSGWALAALRSFAAAALFWWVVRRPATPLWLGAAGALLLFDLVPIARSVNPTLPHEFASPPPAAASLDPDRASYRIFNEADWRSEELPRRFPGMSYPWLVRNALLPMTPAAWGFRTVLEPDYDKTALLPTLAVLSAMKSARAQSDRWADAFMTMSNVRYRISFGPLEQDLRRPPATRLAFPLRAERFPGNDRYYFADELVRIRSSRDFVDHLVRGDASPHAAFVDFTPFVPAAGRVESAKESPNEIELDVSTGGPAFLYLSVTPHRYWKAVIDGRRAALLPANIGYQGLIVPGGRHKVRVRYRNPVVDWSVAVSILVSVLCIGVLARGTAAARVSANGSQG